MSRPRSRSPLFSRIPTLHGRRADGFFDGQIQSSVPSNAWRNTEYDNKAESSTQWKKDSFQGNQQVDHWAKFIDAIEHAQKREALPMSSFHIEGDEKRPSCSPRRLPRERLPSPDQARFGMEERYGMSGTPGWNRSDDSDRHLGRHEPILQQNQRDSRHSEARRYDRADYEYHNEELGNRHHERGSFSERSSKSDFRGHHLSLESFTHLGQQNEYGEDRRGFSPRRTPVIVEHDHGILKREPRNRDLPRTSDHPRSKDPSRRNEAQRDREPQRDHRRDQGHHAHTSQGRHSRASSSEESRRHNVREESRRHYSSYEGDGQVRDRSRHMDRSRMDLHSRDLDGRREMMEVMDMNDIDLRTERSHKERDNEWGDEGFRGNNGRMMEQQEVRQQTQYQRNPNTKSRSVPRMDFGEQETLKIKVDMSRPIGQSSYLGYSSDRQLSLDLVNVGRQRLDFLPMLEHSGTYRESAVHSGTFAQEIITLVHQVKENYFKGQGITLNERFASEQYYSLLDDFREEEEEDEERERVRPIMNRPLGMPLSETQIFCKIGAEPPQKQQLVSDPGDLRYDLERRRQQRLEGVKITIAGGSFTQMAPESQRSERPYALNNPDRSEGNFGRSDQPPERQRQWNGPHERKPVPNRQNVNQRSNSNRNNRARGRRT